MNRRDRKLEILRQLGQEAEPISLSELFDKIALGSTKRSVRRLLNELVSEGFVQKYGNTKGAKYIAIKAIPTSKCDSLDQESYAVKQVSSCFSSQSLYAVEKVTKPLFERQIVAYNKDWLDSYIPNNSFYLPVYLKKQLHKAGQRATEQDPAGTYAHKIFNRLLIDLSYNSSRLEGNTYSLLDTERLLLHGNTPEGKLDEEKIMILNHKEAIRFLVDNAPRLELSTNTIYTLHFLLSDGLVEPKKYAGKVRDHSIRIGGSTYIPFENPELLQFHLDEIIKKVQRISDPFEQSIFLLVHISYIQAFVDVNKRTARLAANIPLIKNNLVPLAFNDIPVEDYISAMIAVYELQDIRPIADIYVYSYLRTCAVYDSTVKSLGIDEIRVRYRSQRRAVLREVILQKLVGFEADKYIKEQAKKLIPTECQEAFIEDAQEDLELINQNRIFGLGITPQELNEWLVLSRKK